MSRRTIAVAAATLAALGAACAPPAPAATPTPDRSAAAAPAPQPTIAPTTTTTTTTTAPPPLADPVPGFVRSTLAPLTSYEVTYDTLPPEVLTHLRHAVSSASAASGIRLTLIDHPSNGSAPAFGEIRVRMGNLCEDRGAVGCAVVYGTATRITGADMTVDAVMLGDPRLRSVVLHEFAHTLGLAHVDTTGFRPQVMGNNGEPLTDYQAGDLAGLAAAGQAARAAGQLRELAAGTVTAITPTS